MSAVERLAEIEGRAAAATTGPWDWDAACWGDPSNGPTKHDVRATVGRDDEVISVASTDYDRMGADDAAFIAHARADVPALTAALRAVLALHSPGAMHYAEPTCAGCETVATFTHWPCSTVTAITAALA